MVERAREGLQFVEVGGEEKERLVAWMCVVCAAVSKGVSRGWFVGKLVGLGTLYDTRMETGMDRLLSLWDVFGKGCIEEIWEEVRMTSNTLVAENWCQASAS